jgi:hypothetical protein
MLCWRTKCTCQGNRIRNKGQPQLTSDGVVLTSSTQIYKDSDRTAQKAWSVWDKQINQLMLYREIIIAVCSEIRTKHTNTLRGQKVEFFIVKPGGKTTQVRDLFEWFVTYFFQWGVVSTSPNPQLEDHPLSAVRNWLFNIFPSILHIPSGTWGRAMSWWHGPTYQGRVRWR